MSYRISERRACRVTRLHRGTYRYSSHKNGWTALRMRIREIAQTRVPYGYRKIRVLLNREGWAVGKTLVQRLYHEEGLALKQRPKRRKRAAEQRGERVRATEANQAWSLDFVADQLSDRRRFRALTIVDVFTRESLAIRVGQALKGTDVVDVLNRLRFERRAPKALFCDNGSEFTSQIMDLWAYQNGVKIDFSRPGKPTDNAYIETFNGTLRAECLDTHWFETTCSTGFRDYFLRRRRRDVSHARIQRWSIPRNLSETAQRGPRDDLGIRLGRYWKQIRVADKRER